MVGGIAVGGLVVGTTFVTGMVVATAFFCVGVGALATSRLTVGRVVGEAGTRVWVGGSVGRVVFVELVVICEPVVGGFVGCGTLLFVGLIAAMLVVAKVLGCPT